MKFHPLYEVIGGWSKNIFIPKTQLAPAVSLFSFPTRGSHNATSSSPLLPKSCICGGVEARGGIEWIPLIGGGGEAGFILLVGKKPEVGEKRVYRISRKFFGFVVFLSHKNLEKKSSIYTKTT
jgi:hypothetical protein